MSSDAFLEQEQTLHEQRGLTVQGQLPPLRHDVLGHDHVHDRVRRARCTDAPRPASGSTGRGTAPRRCRAARPRRRRTSPRRSSAPPRDRGRSRSPSSRSRRAYGRSSPRAPTRRSPTRGTRASPCAAGSAACHPAPEGEPSSSTTGDVGDDHVGGAQHAGLQAHEIAAAQRGRRRAPGDAAARGRPRSRSRRVHGRSPSTTSPDARREARRRDRHQVGDAGPDERAPARLHLAGDLALATREDRPDVLGAERPQVAHRLGGRDVEVAHEQHHVVLARGTRPDPLRRSSWRRTFM